MVDLETLERLRAEATPGPWGWEVPQTNIRIRSCSGDFIMEKQVGRYYVRRETDAALIVTAVNAMPALIAELRAARQDAARVPDLLAALKLLVADVEPYEAWQRPCYALDVACAAIAKGTP